MKRVFKIKYVIDNDSMTDEQFFEQPQRTLIITSSMLERLVREYDNEINSEDTIDYEHFEITKL